MVHAYHSTPRKTRSPLAQSIHPTHLLESGNVVQNKENSILGDRYWMTFYISVLSSSVISQPKRGSLLITLHYMVINVCWEVDVTWPLLYPRSSIPISTSPTQVPPLVWPTIANIHTYIFWKVNESNELCKYRLSLMFRMYFGMPDSREHLKCLLITSQRLFRLNLFFFISSRGYQSISVSMDVITLSSHCSLQNQIP